MPTRLIREGILSSDKVNLLDWAEECFYHRLLNRVDDHGLYDARPSILRASLYPLKVRKVSEKDCRRWLSACQKAGLVVVYEQAGKQYLQVLNTRWKARSEPKYPLPPENSCKQLQTTENTRTVVVVEDVYEGGDGDGKKSKPTKTPLPANFKISEKVKTWAEEKGFTDLEPDLEFFVGRMKANGKTYIDWDEAFMNCVREDWAGLRKAKQ